MKIVESAATQLKLAVVKAVCWLLLPRGLWVGKNFGPYTCRWLVSFGRIDSRGVLRGITEQQAIDALKVMRERRKYARND